MGVLMSRASLSKLFSDRNLGRAGFAMGALALFSAVVAKDAERAARCVDYCNAREFSTGTIGPSIDRTPANRFVACTCTGPDRDALELRADSLAR
jgi:hypothetical protein